MIKKLLKDIITFIYLKYHGVQFSFGKVTLNGFPIIRRHSNSTISIGNNVTINSSKKSNPAGINAPTMISTISSEAKIFIGDGSGISGAIICASDSIVLNENVGIGVGCRIYDTDFHPIHYTDRRKQKSIFDADHSPVVIDSDAWLAADVMVLKGVTIGQGSVIGARSLVSRSISANSLAIGVPAKEVKKIN